MLAATASSARGALSCARLCILPTAKRAASAPLVPPAARQFSVAAGHPFLGATSSPRVRRRPPCCSSGSCGGCMGCSRGASGRCGCGERHGVGFGVGVGMRCFSGGAATGKEFEHLPPMSDEEKAYLDEQARIIFGHRPWSPVRTGNKVLRKKLVGPLYASASFKPFEDVLRSEFPEYLTDKEERRKQKLAYMRRRGKGPPKKGQGKRAGKKK